MAAKNAVIGIDIGTAESLVAYVGKGVVDLVQNEVSRRATPSLVSLTDRERLLGDAALAQIRSNAKNTCRNFKHLLGRSASASDLEKEHFWSTSKLGATSDGTAGYDVTYKGESRVFSAVPITAMFLTQLKEITEKWCQAKVTDAVLSVPAHFSDINRQAVLDAARIAGIKVLRLINEHTATALAYGIYRSNDLDIEKPLTVAFCSMGHSLFSVSIVQFIRGKMTVLCEKSDKVGGRDMDECLMREFAAQFKKKHGCDPLSNKKSAFKLEDAVTKTKKILSSNSEAPISIECLMEDEDLAGNMTRSDFENMCQPMMDSVKAVLDGVLSMCGIPLEQIDSVEIVGGASRVPWFKRMCSEAFGGKELSTTMNADESVARGCALQAAILSPLYKVRDFKVEDCTKIGVSLDWTGAADVVKTADVFPSGSYMNVLKLLTFFKKGPFELSARYADEDSLPPDTCKKLGTYKIGLPPQNENAKVKVKAKLTLNGTFTVEGAQVLEDEEFEETVREQREVQQQPAEAETEEAKQDADVTMTDAERKPTEEKKDEPMKDEEEKKFEWVDVVVKKMRIKRTDVKVTVEGTPGLDWDAIQNLIDEETAMQREKIDILETDEKRNDLESYVFDMRAKIQESGEYADFISDKDREKFMTELQKAEDWLYDNEGATKKEYIEKLTELQKFGNPVVWRCKEKGLRLDAMSSIGATIAEYRSCAENPGRKYGHIAPEKRAKIISACTELEKWLAEKMEKQEKLPGGEQPTLTVADMEKRKTRLSNLADEILSEPRPPPPPPPRPKPTPKKEEEEKKDDKKEDKKDEKKEETKDEAPKGTAKEKEAPEAPRQVPVARDGPENMDVD